MPEENLNPNPAGTEQAPVEETPQQTNAFEDLRAKKGWKDNESVAKSYTELESTHGRTQNAFNTAKTQVETQSQGAYTLDDKGGMILTEKGQQMQQQQPQGQYQQQNQYQQPQEQPDPIYDPYSGKQITDPIALQLAQLPMGQREAFLFNAMSDQREKQQMSAFQHETEILSSDAAKGFEQDVKKVMMSLPIAQRANKQTWNQALLQVKGARYDDDRKNWGTQANDDLLNKMGNQGLPAAGGVSSAGGTQLPGNLEAQYTWYTKNRPGFFKDRSEFMKYTSPTGGK